MAETKKIWTEQEIRAYVARNDKALYGALSKLSESAIFAEFSIKDRPFLTTAAMFLQKCGYLSDSYKEEVRRRLANYTTELTGLANM